MEANSIEELIGKKVKYLPECDSREYRSKKVQISLDLHFSPHTLNKHSRSDITGQENTYKI